MDFVPLYSNIGKAARQIQRVLFAMTVSAYGSGQGCLHQGNQWRGLQTFPDWYSNNTFDHDHRLMQNGCRNSRWMDSPAQPIHTSHQRTPELLYRDKDLVDQKRSSVPFSCHFQAIPRTSNRHLNRHWNLRVGRPTFRGYLRFQQDYRWLQFQKSTTCKVRYATFKISFHNDSMKTENSMISFI